MQPDTIKKIRAIGLYVADTDSCLWQLAELVRDELRASQTMIALWSGQGESPNNWRAWTAGRSILNGRQISAVGGSLTLLNAARMLGQIEIEAVSVADISKTASINAHDIRYGMAFPLKRNDELTRSIQFSGVFYVDRRGGTEDFNLADREVALDLSAAVESTVALVHANLLVRAGLPNSDSKRQIWPVVAKKIEEHAGQLSALAKDAEIVGMMCKLEPSRPTLNAAGPTLNAVRRLIAELGLEPMRLDKQTRQPAQARLDELDAMILEFGDMKKAACAMGIEYNTFRQQRSRAAREVLESKQLTAHNYFYAL